MPANFTPTTERLAVALEEERAPKWMVEAARAGRYDDYKSDLALPLTQLVTDCRFYGLTRMVPRIKDGEFDCVRQEADEWAMTEEGRRIFAEFHQSRYSDECRGLDD